MIPPSTCQPRQTDRSGLVPESTVTTPSYTTSGDTILAPAASLSTILGAQEVEADRNERRGAAARYGGDLLDRLAELRLNLLNGALPAAQLHALARALRADRQTSGDPGIEGVIEE